MFKKTILILLWCLLISPASAQAAFDFSLAEGYGTIDFGAMDLGEEKTLAARAGYEHQFNFTSDNGKRWYFKAQLVRPFTNGANSIPVENFQWIVEQVRDGRGAVSTNISVPRPFSTTAGLIYTSADTDNTGTTVRIRMKYNLEIPQQQAAGAYTAHIRFIMVEEL